MTRLLAIGWLLAVSALAAEPLTRFYMVGIADPDELLECAREAASADAKVWFNAQRSVLYVTDNAQRQERIAALVRSLQRPPRTFVLHVRYPDFVTLPGQPQAPGISGGDRTGLTGMSSSPFGPGKIRFGGAPPPVAEPGQRLRAGAPQPSPADSNVTTLTVTGGKGAWLMVSPQPPNAAWIYQWGAGRYWPAAPGWTQVKTHLYVEPKLRDDRILLRLLPAVAYTAGGAQRNLALQPVMGERMALPGEEIEVTAALGSGDEFYEKFFMTYDRARQPQPVQIWITPTVQ